MERISEVVGVSEICESLGISERTFYRYRDKGVFPGMFKIGQKNLMFKRDFEKLKERWAREGAA